MKIKNHTREWHCELITVKGEYKGVPLDENFDCGAPTNTTGYAKDIFDEIIAPLHWSYACNKLTFINSNYTLAIGGMQVS